MTKQNKKRVTAKPTSWRPSKRTVVIATMIGIVLLAVGIHIKNEFEKSTQPKAYAMITQIDKQMTFGGALAYDKITDNGCGPDASSWLRTTKVCGVMLTKLYKGKGGAETNLLAANNVIRNHGWGAKRSNLSFAKN